MKEEPASCSPHFRLLSSYCIPQMSENSQIKILINFLTIRSKFLMHSASMIKKKKTAYLSLASAPVVLSWGETRQDSSSVWLVV
jgi:hypothetical protein